MGFSMSTDVAADRIYAELRRRIISTELRPGSLLHIRDIANEFGTSPTPVRDALQVLDRDGLVEVSPRARTRVKPVTLKSLVDVLDIREATGPMCCRLVVQYATDADIDSLEEVVEQVYDGADHVETILSASHDFHCRVALLSGNARLHQITELCLQDLERSLRVCGAEPHRGGETSLVEHRALLAAFRARDADLAMSIELAHIQTSRTAILALAVASGAFFNS
ncbi:DNA-binding GntR family transcriptional regulator [Rhodococcus sp. 27YEA15]